MKNFPPRRAILLGTVFCALLVAFYFPESTRGDDNFQGAEAILKQADAAVASNGGPGQPQSPREQLQADAARYADQSASLPPEESARAWLALYDRATRLSSPTDSFRSGESDHSVNRVFRVLPPPAAWDALAAQVAVRGASTEQNAWAAPVLRVLVGTLQGDFAAVRRALDALPAFSAGDPFARYAVRELRNAVAEVTKDGPAKLAAFEHEMALLRPAAELSPDEVQERETMRSNTLDVPDLVTLAGPERAETLLKQMFSLPLERVRISDKRTKGFAHKVALEMGDQLKFAPWNLVDTLDAMPLYELLARRFPDPKPNEKSERASAEGYYLLGLVAQGRQDDAAAFALKLGQTRSGDGDAPAEFLFDQPFSELAMQGHATAVCRFFDALLSAHPELPYWHAYTVAAVLAGETDTMLAKLKTASDRADLKPRAKAGLHKAYGAALLAADHVAEALPILKGSAAETGRAPDEHGTSNAAHEQLRDRLQLATLGQLLDDQILLNEQLDAIVKMPPAAIDSYSDLRTFTDDELTNVFLAAKRGPELERLYGDMLAQGLRDRAEKAKSGTSNRHFGDFYAREIERAPLGGLVALYDRAGRSVDVVALLDHGKPWNASDVADLLDSSLGFRHSLIPPLARALQRTGHADAALRLVNADLEREGSGDDPDYALLLELLPPERAEARLNELFQGDQFQERPLIWRAVVQLKLNRLDEAEKSARQAISIDPSDGEQGRGDRMRAYAVLGDILERKGDAPQAKQMRQAVQAIRMSEDADRLHSAGLLKRAVDLYEQALGHFADAYCIQSRLAIQLTALGKFDEAMTHYERAYELMPDSFGRMESHCFGCERAFAGERAQNVAERVFQRLAAKQPDNPKVHYLLGYLRKEEDRNAEAAHEFREAVRLDPDYINAWKQLAEISNDPADRDHAMLNLLRLDPRQRHESSEILEVSDLRALWKAVEAAAKFALPKLEKVYPLTASQEYIEENRRGQAASTTNEEIYISRFNSHAKELSDPRTAILKTKIIAHAMQVLSRPDED